MFSYWSFLSEFIVKTQLFGSSWLYKEWPRSMLQDTIKNDFWQRVSQCVLHEMLLYITIIMHSPYSLLCAHQITLAGQVLSIYRWTNFSIRSTRSPVTFPTASSTRIGTTVTKLTDTEDGPVLSCVEAMYCWRILNWTPLWRRWDNL